MILLESTSHQPTIRKICKRSLGRHATTRNTIKKTNIMEKKENVLCDYGLAGHCFATVIATQSMRAITGHREPVAMRRQSLSYAYSVTDPRIEPRPSDGGALLSTTVKVKAKVKVNVNSK